MNLTSNAKRWSWALGVLWLSACEPGASEAPAPPALTRQAEPPPAQVALSATAPSGSVSSILDQPIAPPQPVQEPLPTLAAPEPAPAPVAPSHVPAAGDVQLERFELAHAVEEREPVGASDVFQADTPRIWAFLHLRNAGPAYELEVHFEPVDGPPSEYGVPLTVPQGDRHRTWAWTAIRRPPGQYRAVVRTRAGEQVAERLFEILP